MREECSSTHTSLRAARLYRIRSTRHWVIRTDTPEEVEEVILAVNAPAYHSIAVEN